MKHLQSWRTAWSSITLAFTVASFGHMYLKDKQVTTKPVVNLIILYNLVSAI